MAASVVSHVKENKHIYTHPYNIITLTLWGLALGTHAFLGFRLAREIYADFTKKDLKRL